MNLNVLSGSSLISSGISNGAASSSKIQAVEQKISEAFSELLSDLGVGSSGATVSIQTPSSQNNGEWQISVALANPTAATTATTTSSSAGTTAVAPEVATPAAPVASQSAQKSADDAYWASQPAAVQQLRNISDPLQREDLATQLSMEGYSIDVPIMAWGWDPSQVTSLRQGFGYTWVPSMMQPSIQVAPGLTCGNLQTYNAADPPAGSILVPKAAS